MYHLTVIVKYFNSQELDPINASNTMCIMKFDTVQDVLSLPGYEQ